MRLGGLAMYVIDAEKPEDVSEAYGFANLYHLPIFPLGFGANTLAHDEGFPGVILRNRMTDIGEDKISDDISEFRVEGGADWDEFVEIVCDKGLTGVEALSKIPSSVGAAPVQNIGAYGQEFSGVVKSVQVFDSFTLQFRELRKAELKFSYRKSVFNSEMKGRFFVIAVILKLNRGNLPRPFYRSIEKYIDDTGMTDFSPKGIREIVSAIRSEKLPDPHKIASAGSFFKNPFVDFDTAEKLAARGCPVYRNDGKNKISAGWLIEKAGLKGKLLHGIRVSDKAALVLINESAQSFADLDKARAEILSKVYDDFGIWLEQEPEEIQR